MRLLIVLRRRIQLLAPRTQTVCNRIHMGAPYLSCCLDIPPAFCLEYGICAQANADKVKDALKDIHLPASMPNEGGSEKCHPLDKTDHED